MTRLSTAALRAAVPEAVHTIARALRDAGFRSWAVGGCVRDELLTELFPERGAPKKNDWDLATDARPEQVQKLFRRVIPTGVQHGTVTVLLRGERYEVTTLRGETTYSDGRRPDDVFFVSDLTEDLERRDFTVNAIAYDVLADELHDPFDGVDDLRRRLLRAVGDPPRRFAEDGLRVLRGARLAATLDMSLEDATRAAIAPSLDSYRQVSAERIRDEWFKAFKARQPSRAFEIMRDEGLLEITAPELLRLREIVEAGLDVDALTLSFRAMDLLSADPALRFAGLCHALGADHAQDPSPSAEDPQGGVGAAAASRARALAARLRLSNADRDRVVTIVRHHRLPSCVEGGDAEVRRWLREVTPQRVEDVLAVQGARLRAAHHEAALETWSAFRERVRALLATAPPLSARDLAVTGRDLIEDVGLPPGPVLGRTLEALVEVVLDDPSANTRESLLGHARRLSAAQLAAGPTAQPPAKPPSADERP